MPESIVFSIDLPVSPERVYRAWLDAYEHSQFTGKKAQISSTPGQAYTSLDNQVSGHIVTATPFNHIVTTWNTSLYPTNSPASHVDIRLEPTCTGCLLTLQQTGIPDGFSRQVLDLWEKAYFRPLKDYFDAIVGDYVVDMDG
jgi:activator of HSP90 ATPase